MSQEEVKADQELKRGVATEEDTVRQAFLDLREYLKLRAEASHYLSTRPKVIDLMILAIQCQDDLRP